MIDNELLENWEKRWQLVRADAYAEPELKEAARTIIKLIEDRKIVPPHLHITPITSPARLISVPDRCPTPTEMLQLAPAKDYVPEPKSDLPLIIGALLFIAAAGFWLIDNFGVALARAVQGGR